MRTGAEVAVTSWLEFYILIPVRLVVGELGGPPHIWGEKPNGKLIYDIAELRQIFRRSKFQMKGLKVCWSDG
jgi:hypothetical protein